MKRKFSKILGVGLTLALLASLLMTAAPVLADVDDVEVDVDDPEIGASTEYIVTFDVTDEVGKGDYSLYEGDLGSATRSAVDNGEDPTGPPDPDAPGGSILLAHNNSGDGSVYVDVVPLPSTTITMTTWTAAITAENYSWYHWRQAVTRNWEQIEFYFEDPTSDAWAEITCVPAQNVLGGATWAEQTLVATTPTGYGGHTEIGTSFFEWGLIDANAVEGAINGLDGGDCTPTGWILTRVRVDLWEPEPEGYVYIDDIVIPPTTYSFEDDEAEPGTITIEFPEDTGVAGDWLNADVTVQSTAGFGALNEETGVGLSATTTDDDDVYTVTIELLQLAENIGEGASVRVNFLNGTITNPDDPDDYTLWVSTSEEDEPVESEPYEIEVPDVDVLAGVVEAYNASDILMASDTGPGAIERILGEADEDWTIKIGEGLYVENTITKCYDITIEGSGDAEDIIIEGVFTIAHEGITLDGVTLDGEGADNALVVNDIGFTLENCILEDADEALVDVVANDDEDPTVIDDCTFNIEDETGILAGGFTEITDSTFNIEEDGEGVAIEIDADITVEDCTFNGGSGVGVEINSGDSEISGCTFDGLETAIDVVAGAVSADGNTMQNCADVAILVAAVVGEDAIVLIYNNTFTGNDDAALLDVSANADLVLMMFNTITDNDGDEDLLVINDDDTTDIELVVVNNWWGDADGPGDDAFGGDGSIVSEPFLPCPVADDASLAAATDDFDAEDECGIIVRSDAVAMGVVAAASYEANPAAELDDVVGFWDVCVIEGATPLTEITIRFYTDVTDETEVWAWGEARGEWLECEQAISNLFAGFISVAIDGESVPTLDDLEALPFAVVEPPAEAAELDPIVITAPESGAEDISLKPTFAWGTVDDAIGYDFELADNPLFVTPLVSWTGDVARLITPFYQQVAELEYSNYYYWRVKAVSEDGESPWSPAVFMTVAEPVEEEEVVVVWTCPQCGLTFATRAALAAHADTAHPPAEPPEIVVEAPDVIVPAETPITPTWIYAIIAVGAVLVISVIVLIVRTRRVA